ncbi:MAG: replication initiator protein [Microviridae sp.]|nr:MAG: replication initiator protein [Microviridae sp.]
MKHCMSPYMPTGGAEPPFFNGLTARYERRAVACGRCDACIANRKQDWTGRLVAESLSSASVAFVTLTYKREQKRFDYKHVQVMLRKLRDALRERDREQRVRFFCVGERGDLKGRRHWHLLLFFKRPYDIGRTVPGELWDFWPHGWASLEDVSEDFGLTVKKVRYCVMYCLKDAGSADGERLRCSLKPALGSEYLCQHADNLAKQGFAPDGKYRFESIRWNAGHRAGELQTFTICGAVRKDYVKAFDEAWEFYHGPERRIHSPWLDRWRECRFPWGVQEARALFWKQAASPGLGMIRREHPEQAFTAEQLVLAEAVAAEDTSSAVGVRMLSGRSDKGYWVALLRVYRDGACYVEAMDGKWYFVPGSVADVLVMSPGAVRDADEWIAAMRPDYEANRKAYFDEQAKKAHDRKARADFLRAHCASLRAALREKHGSSRDAQGIYGRQAFDKDGYARGEARLDDRAVRSNGLLQAISCAQGIDSGPIRFYRAEGSVHRAAKG